MSEPSCEERWLAVPGYEGLYEVSSTGLIRSLARTVTRRGRSARLGGVLLRQPLNDSGYPCVTLWREGVPKKERVHRIVALAFHGEPPTAQHEVAHGDGTRTNNAAENLRWATRAENVADAIRHGTAHMRERHHMAKLDSARVAEVRRLAAAGLGSNEISRRVGVSRQSVRDVVAGRTWRSARDEDSFNRRMEAP